ncbi:16S rRNA methyltransferase rsmB/F domain-containing protein [Ditylenchus destructor]|nr:16S rRNA methyltransferase rsmB/F domain-containing protein [Ditylenchus destructor]
MKKTKQNEAPETLNAKRLVRDSQFKVLGVEGMSADELQVHDHIIEYPEDLCLRIHERGSLSYYPAAMKDEWGMSSWWLLDGGSILPVLALDLRETDSVLDMCAAPGGKSLLIVQSKKFSSLVCNDEKLHRLGQLRRALAMYIPNDCEEANKVVIKKKDAGTMEGWDELEIYDKVLVDAPCSNDRLSTALDSTDNLFAAINTAQRLDLPQLQTRLLVNALRSVKVGGSVVYSTCTLSPNQNEAVVENAVALANTYFGIQCVEQSLQRLKVNFSNTGMFFFAENRICKRGILAVPNVLGNFGPMYVCKLKRTR